MNLSLWIIFLIFISCGSQNESEVMLKQAHEIHLEAIKLNMIVQPKLERAVRSKNQIEKRGGELDTEKETFIKKVAQLERSYMFWEENHVEVPGFEDHIHDHHDHDHQHKHGTTLEVSAEDMLLIQQEFKDSIALILKRLEGITLPTIAQ